MGDKQSICKNHPKPGPQVKWTGAYKEVVILYLCDECYEKQRFLGTEQDYTWENHPYGHFTVCGIGQ